VGLLRKAADEVINHDIFIQIHRRKKKLVVTSNKLTNNFAGRFTSGIGLDVARGSPVG
jgi:hypothetical protein